MAESATINGSDIIKWGKLTWVNINKPTAESMKYLEQNYSFHPLNLDDCLSKVHLPKIDEYEKYVFIILHFPVTEPVSKITVPSQVAFFLGKDFLVSIHSGDLSPLINVPATCQGNEKTCADYLGGDAGYLLYRIVNELVDHCFPIVDNSLAMLDKIEARVNDPDKDTSRQITILRRDIAAQRRIIRLLRNTASGIEPKLRHFAANDLKPYFDDISDHLDHLWNDVEECHETAEIYKDTYLLLRQERNNKIMALLTIVFTISLPASVLATFFGMHVNIPWGTENSGWVGPLGPYTAFLAVVGASVAMAGLMFILFRKWKWL